MLVPSCQQVWNKLLTISNNRLLILMIRLVTQLFQQVRYSHDIAVLLQPCVVNLVTFLFTMTVSNLLEQLGANTTCRQLVNRLVTTCCRPVTTCVFLRLPPLPKYNYNLAPRIWEPRDQLLPRFSLLKREEPGNEFYKFSLNVFVSYFLSCVERIITYFSFKTASSFALHCLIR
jgi:hypothetical protein